MNEIVALFSGGTDSTLAVALATEQAKTIHLLTYYRFGLFKLENSSRVVIILESKYPASKFIHHILSIEQIFKKLSYEQYFKNLLKHRFMNLSTCGICKLSMHVKTILYCIEHNIQHVIDGANHSMDIYPAQMKEVIHELKTLYREYGINYESPVFDYQSEDDKSLIFDGDKLLRETQNAQKSQTKPDKVSTNKVLFELGLSPHRFLKGTSEDRKRQGRCFQLVILHIYYKKFFLFFSDFPHYKKRSISFMKDKIKAAKQLINSESINNH